MVRLPRLQLACFTFALLLPLLAASQGVVVVAGGGREGDQGDTSSWSYKLYRKLIENGDRTGDGIVQIAILTTLLKVNDPNWYSYAEASPNANPPGLGLTHAQAVAQALLDDAWLPNYLQWIGSSAALNVQAFNVEVATLAVANDASRVGLVAGADGVFIKGGDQGEYYDKWNDTLLEAHIRTVVQTRVGGVGGTSAGAMSQAQYCFCGSSDLISTDVLANAQTAYLDDVSQPGTSAIHTDFLGFVSGVFIDTHYTQRARMGRLLGVLARAVDDSGDRAIVAIGLDQKTGISIKNGVAEVIGVGEAAFFRESASTQLRRDAGRPLFYTELVLDRLTEGWQYDLAARAPLTHPLPAGTILVTYPGDGAANSGALSIAGSVEADANRFEWLPRYAPSDYLLGSGSASPFVRGSLGFSNAGASASRAAKHETLFRALFDQPNAVAILAFNGGTLSRTSSAPDVLSFGGTLASIIVDAKSCTYKGLSPAISSYAITGGALRAAALTNLRVHVIAESASPTRGASFNTRRHSVVGGALSDSIFADSF